MGYLGKIHGYGYLEQIQEAKSVIMNRGRKYRKGSRDSLHWASLFVEGLKDQVKSHDQRRMRGKYSVDVPLSIEQYLDNWEPKQIWKKNNILTKQHNLWGFSLYFLRVSPFCLSSSVPKPHPVSLWLVYSPSRSLYVSLASQRTGKKWSVCGQTAGVRVFKLFGSSHLVVLPL